MLSHQSLIAERRSAHAVPSKWLDRWGAPGLFVFALALCAVSFVRYVSFTPAVHSVRQPVKVKAHPPIDVFSLHRAPTVAAGAFRYAVLGYGQDEASGAQIVWIRSITTNRVGGFKEGERLFQGPVKVASIEAERLVLQYQGEDFEAPIQP